MRKDYCKSGLSLNERAGVAKVLGLIGRSITIVTEIAGIIRARSDFFT
jgi:hypothetical protein